MRLAGVRPSIAPASWYVRFCPCPAAVDKANVHTPTQRSRNMAAIRERNTRPEKVVRSILHRAGFRFRLYRSDLPAKPDIILPKYRTVVLVHGCFWHMHKCRYGRVIPVQNGEFWRVKRTGNVTRDKNAQAKLRRMGWRVVVVWECWTRDPERVENLLRKALAP